MIVNTVIESLNFYIKNLGKNNELSNYLNWMRDEVNHRFIEGVAKNTSIQSLEQYVKSNNQSSDSVLFGIFTIDTQLHIGNIRLTKIDSVKKEAYIGVLIGESQYRQKGVACETMTKTMEWAREELGINTFKLGCNIMNKPALKLYKKMGFRIYLIKLKRNQIAFLMRKTLEPREI